jgi:hypothetical protein
MTRKYHKTNSTVCLVRPNDPHSPLYKEPLFIQGVFVSSVAEYMSLQEPTFDKLLKAMMCKYCQNIHLQKIFQDDVKLVFDRTGIDDQLPWFDFINTVYTHCAYQFKRSFDANVLIHWLPLQEGETHELWTERMAFFQLSQPAVGRDRASELSTMWLGKKINKVRYDLEVEEELASFECKGVFELT